MSREEKVFKTNFRKSKLVYNYDTKLLLSIFLCFLIALSLALVQEIYASWLDEVYSIDYWGFAHIFFCSGLYLLFYLITKNRNVSLILTFVLTTMFEPLEWALANVFNLTRNLYYEQIGNQVADIIFNLLGMLISHFYVENKGEKNFENI